MAVRKQRFTLLLSTLARWVSRRPAMRFRLGFAQILSVRSHRYSHAAFCSIEPRATQPVGAGRERIRRLGADENLVGRRINDHRPVWDSAYVDQIVRIVR